MAKLPELHEDLQASSPEIALALSRAGVSGVQKAVRIRRGRGELPRPSGEGGGRDLRAADGQLLVIEDPDPDQRVRPGGDRDADALGVEARRSGDLARSYGVARCR